MRVFRCSMLLALAALAAACGQQTQTPAPPAASESAQAAPAAPTTAPTSRAAAAPAPRTSPAPAPVERPAEPARAAVPPAPTYVVVDVPAGTEIEVELLDTLSSGTSRVGDPFRARLVNDLVANGRRVAPAGTEVRGSVSQVVPLKKFGGQPMLTLAFESLALEGGERVPLAATLVQQGKKQAGRDAAKIGGGAAAGAVVGHQVDDDKGAAIGAIVGGAIGTAVAAKTGKEVELPAGTTVVVALESEVQVRLES